MSETNWPPTFAAHLGDRSAFPTLEADAYLAHCAISPPSAPVIDAATRVFADFARQGVSAYMSWMERREGLRAGLAGLISAQAQDVGLVANTTRGISTVALGFPWRAGDTVVVFRGEFPTNVTPWQQAAERFDLRVEFQEVSDFAGSSGAGLEKLEARLEQGGVAMVAVSAVQFQTGLRMPVAQMTQLAHAHGAQLCCDAIQAVGSMPIDVGAQGVDYLCAGSHKWMMGLEGCGMLYVAPDRIAALRPTTAGWLSHETPLDFLSGPGALRYDKPIRSRADFVEVGAAPSALLAALEVAVLSLSGLGLAEIWAHIQSYLDPLEAGLEARGFTSVRSGVQSQRSAILSVQPPPGVELDALVDGLGGRGIVVSHPDGHLRFAPHWPNDLAEVPRVLAAIDGLV